MIWGVGFQVLFGFRFRAYNVWVKGLGYGLLGGAFKLFEKY